MFDRWIWELRFALAGALTWISLAVVIAACGVTCYLAGPWPAVGTGVAGVVVLYAVVGPMVARLQGTGSRS